MTITILPLLFSCFAAIIQLLINFTACWKFVAISLFLSVISENQEKTLSESLKFTDLIYRILKEYTYWQEMKIICKIYFKKQLFQNV